MATIKICDICGSIKGPILGYYLPKLAHSSDCNVTHQGKIIRFQPKEYDICEECATAINEAIASRERNRNE